MCQFVKICSSSSTKPLLFGLPQHAQGSTHFVTFYTAPLADIAGSHQLGNHFCADDLQLYAALETHDRLKLWRNTRL